MVPVSVETSPRELTCSPGELVRSTLQNADPVTSRRRVVGRRTIIPLEPFASPDTVDPVKLDENINDVEVPEAPESSDGGSKKRGVESFDEPVDWFQRERANSSPQQEIFEIDVGALLDSEESFCRHSSAWLSKRLPEVKASEVSNYRLLPGQQLQFVEAMTKELLQVLAAVAVRRISQEEELNLKPVRVLRMRWLLV